MVGGKGQIRITKALVKFCAAYHCPTGWVSRLNEIAKLLEKDDKRLVLYGLKYLKLEVWATPRYLA